MSTEDNKALIRRKVEVLNQGNVATIDELATPNFVFHDPNNPQAHSRQEYFSWLTDLWAALSPQLTIEDMIAEGDKVVMRYALHGTHQKPWRGVSPTGKPVTITATITYRISDGKLAEAWQNADALGLVQQLGLFPASVQAR
ncbi:MAG: ester cyclase [Ktedonobacteraceae bacterium]